MRWILPLSAAVALAVLFGLPRGTAQSRPGGRQVMDIQRQVGLRDPEPLAVSFTTLRDGAPNTRTPASKPTSVTQTNLYGSLALNSRLAADLPSGTWKVRWEAPLEPDLPALAILHAGERILLHAAGQWRLFDLSGKALGTGRFTGSALHLDPAPGLFYHINQGVQLEARRLSDGELQFRFPWSFNESFSHPLLCRLGNRLFASGVEMPSMSARPVAPNRSEIEYREMGHPVQVSPSQLLLSITRSEMLVLGTNQLLGAVHNGGIDALTHNALLTVDANLAVKQALSAPFDPLSISVDESGYRYLLISSYDQRALWVIDDKGTRVTNFPIPDQLQGFIAPPIAGYDHRVFLITPAMVLALDAHGKQLWEKTMSPGVAGAAVTPSGLLLIASADRIDALNLQGERREVARIPNAKLITAPSITAAGDLLVASAEKLYCLSTH